jgi:hypothetical protein
MNYQKIYNQIIERAKTRQLEGYKERHHIIPKCLGGDNNKCNLVELTAKEHFLCHRLLVEIYPYNDKLLYALWLMAIGKKRWKTNDPYKMSIRSYELLKNKFIQKSKNKKITDKHKKSLAQKNSRKIIQYDMQGNFIKEWNSAADAERFINNQPKANWKELRNNINDCCRGRQKSSYNFIWKYKEDILYLEEHKNSLDKGNKWKNKPQNI